MSDYVKPAIILDNMVESAVIKANLPASDILIRGALAGAYLGFVTSLAFLVAAQTGQFVVGALLFPAGFALIVILGLELLTGNFGVLPTALFDARIGITTLLRNWALVFIGNLIGSLVYAALFWVAVTDAGRTTAGPIGDQLRALGPVRNQPLYLSGCLVGSCSSTRRGIRCGQCLTRPSRHPRRRCPWDRDRCRVHSAPSDRYRSWWR
jgi:hypothetical protein